MQVEANVHVDCINIHKKERWLRFCWHSPLRFHCSCWSRYLQFDSMQGIIVAEVIQEALSGHPSKRVWVQMGRVVECLFAKRECLMKLVEESLPVAAPSVINDVIVWKIVVLLLHVMHTWIFVVLLYLARHDSNSCCSSWNRTCSCQCWWLTGCNVHNGR
jgi:hypothetical protein